MSFNVGSGVLAKMQELSDTPSRDSMFVNSADQKSRSEYGYGIKYDYRAVGQLVGTSWQWTIDAYKLNLLDPVVSNFSDMRGKLPKRYPNVLYLLRDVSKVDTMCIHYTAAPNDRTVVDIANYQTTVQTGDLFPEIAYHIFIEKTGLLIWCHDVNKRVWGSAQAGMNERAVHVCYSGNDAPNPQQIDALIRAKTFIIYSLLASKPVSVVGHKDGYATQCPGPTWNDWKSKIL